LIRSVWGRPAYLSLCAAAAAILVASGCGDSSSAPVTGVSGASGASGASGSTALAKSAFIKQADAICAEANSAISGLTGGATTGDESLQASQELDITRSQLQSLQALTPPDQDRSTLNDFLSALKNEVDALTRLNSAVASGGDTSAADSELASAKSNAEAAATDYGMKDCGHAKSRPTQADTTTPVTPTTTTPAPTTSVPTTTTAVPTTPTTPPTPTTTAPAPAPPSGGTGGAPSGGTGGGTGGSTGGTGSGGTGGTSP
jgi:hypothetical protein